ncbi:MAG: MFS transporter [Actinomadura sp.]
MTAGGLVPPRVPGARRRPRGLFRHRDFRLLWIGQTTSRLGTSVTSVALPLVAVATLNASTFQVALLSAAAWLPWPLIGLPVGAWVPRGTPALHQATEDVASGPWRSPKR